MKKLTTLDLEYQKDSSHYFERFIHLPFPSLLDSCATSYQGDHCRYDIMTAAPSQMVQILANGKFLLTNNHGKVSEAKNRPPFEILSQLMADMTPVKHETLPFTGGILGYWSYELCELLEPEKIEPRNTGMPLMEAGIYHWALITDHQQQTSQLLFHPDIDPALQKEILQTLDSRPEQNSSFQLKSSFSTTQSKAEYAGAFEKIQDYIACGDSYEVNLTQQFTASYTGDSWVAYKKMREVSPAPYSAYIKTPSINILSHSPERFIRVKGHNVESHPIKGTRPRGITPEQDQQNAQELLNSPKDRAENLMIVDLLRNDLGRVCEIGSIKVPRLFALESYANVHHLVSTVSGRLAKDEDLFSLMASSFPGGSITGAPKIRSMQIIRELEVAERSVYCGAIGYMSCCGNMDTSITIRTMTAHDNRIHCWGGGAIVADSDCEEEYQESITKVKNLMNALETHFQAFF